MDNVLQNLNVDNFGTDFKTTVFLKPKMDFKIGREMEFRILSGNMSRVLFKSRSPVCKSWNGETGRQRNADGKYKGEDIICENCVYLKGINITDGDEVQKIKCQTGYTLILEHPDPDSEYSLNLNMESMGNLDSYSKELARMGLTVKQVITGITREESTKTIGSVFFFRMVRELNIELSEAEKNQLNSMIKMVKEQGAISAVDVKAMLMKLTALKGITEERAARLANLIADDKGMITEEAKFV